MAPAETPTQAKKTYSDIPTPFPDLYMHDPNSGWLNVYDESRVIDYSESYNYIGQAMTVEGPIDSVVYAASSNGRPHFFNLGGGAYEPGGFAIVVWGENLSAFDQHTTHNYVEWSMSDQPITSRIRVSGVIEMYNDRTQITARDGSQVAIWEDGIGWFTLMSDSSINSLMDQLYS